MLCRSSIICVAHCGCDDVDAPGTDSDAENCGWDNCIYRNVPKYRNELEIPKRTINIQGKVVSVVAFLYRYGKRVKDVFHEYSNEMENLFLLFIYILKV